MDTTVDDILRRLGRVESTVTELRSEVAGILAVIPYLATKADLTTKIGAVKAELAEVRIRV
jgi:hypothetical protein